jgi:hypothetical protein
MEENIKESKVAQTVLDGVQELMQTCGFNSFSYRDFS